ncbi:MAG: ABC transporter substrate-binding protein [Acidimicrobiia bacterium]|nr:ABC transporter substrate-binding protein [Acidimicrobiia bacterium]
MRSKALPVLLALALAACGGDGGAGPADTAVTGGTTAIPTPGLPVTYVGPDGVETRVSDATRIVTLSGDMTEIIFALGLGPNIVGCDLSSVYPEEAKQIDKVGVEFVLVAEGVLAQTPTLVIGDEDARPLEAIAQIRQAGIPVVIFPRFMGLEAPAEKIRSVARVLGVDEAGEALAEQVQAEIDAAVASAGTVETRPRVALIYQASADTTLMLGPNSVMDGLFTAVGAVDVGPTAGADAHAPLSAEALVAGDPEVIVTAERGLNRYLGGIEGFLALPGVAQTTAGREGRILVYEDLFLLGLGPRTGQLLARLFADLHPEAAAGS